MKALSRALNIYRPHEREYIAELDGIRKEIEFLEDFIDESPSHRSLAPAIEDLRERETLIRAALRESELPPVPDELRNPFTRPRTPEENEYIRQLIELFGNLFSLFRGLHATRFPIKNQSPSAKFSVKTPKPRTQRAPCTSHAPPTCFNPPPPFKPLRSAAPC